MITSIGTTHPWNIAGVGLDALVAAEYGLAHATVVAAVSAQDASGVRALHTIPADVISAQLTSLPPSAAVYLIGALVCAENVRGISAFLRGRENQSIVVDPVLSATRGGALHTGADVVGALRDLLLTLPVVVTPNIDEAARLTGEDCANPSGMEQAAQALVAGGARAALVTGGHLRGDPVDVLVSAQGTRVYRDSRLPGDMRGAGSTLAAALACELARGKDLQDAVADARAYVRKKIAAARMRGGLQVAF